MGLFGFGKKKKEVEKEVAKEPEKKPAAPDVTPEEQAMIDRLCSKAGNIINMLKHVLTGKNGLDMYLVTLYAAGLAGIACHEAVKETHGELVVVEGKNGKKYYMGDATNKFLHENKFAVTSFIRAITGMPEAAMMGIITRQAQTIGSDNFVVAGNMDPADFYKNVKNCWDGIKTNMTLAYCESPEEWPILYGIVLQNVIKDSLPYVKPEAIFNTSVDVACAMSKMDQESL